MGDSTDGVPPIFYLIGEVVVIETEDGDINTLVNRTDVLLMIDEENPEPQKIGNTTLSKENLDGRFVLKFKTFRGAFSIDVGKFKELE